LRLLGVRTKNVSLVCEALNAHMTACQACMHDTPYWAFMAASAAREDLSALSANFDKETYEASVVKYRWITDFLSKHEGHRIALNPAFKIVIAGTSGNAEPDWKLAPKKGDRIKDGTAIWENAGTRSYCLECREFLALRAAESQ
jgi:hypothetical protein